MNPYSAPAPGWYGSTGTSSYADAPLPYAGQEALPYAGQEHAEVSEGAVEVLRRTRPWVLFLGIMSFVGSALTLAAGIALIALGAVASEREPIPSAVLGALYIPVAALYIYPGLKLCGFASAIARLRATRANVDLTAALTQQKSLWKFVGVLTIVTVALHGALLVAMVLVDLGAAHH